MSERATCWSVTINNPISDDDENIARAKQKSGWKVEGQLEKGENGTPHYQLMVKTPQVRFSAVKSAFPRAHIEVTRNVKALTAYVHKDETREGALPVNDKYPSINKLWCLLTDWIGEYVPTDPDERLAVFDQFISDMIERGYHVETMGVNPQLRSCVKKYLPALLYRSEKIRRQTDRQTELISEDSINGQENEDAQSQSTSSSSSTDWSDE